MHLFYRSSLSRKLEFWLFDYRLTVSGSRHLLRNGRFFDAFDVLMLLHCLGRNLLALNEVSEMREHILQKSLFGGVELTSRFHIKINNGKPHLVLMNDLESYICKILLKYYMMLYAVSLNYEIELL